MTTLTSDADVSTDAPDRYAKQLASHLGRKAEVRDEAEGARVVLTGGSCLLSPGDGVIRLRAVADDAEAMERVQRVVGGHLERFGAKVGLTVTWSS